MRLFALCLAIQNFSLPNAFSFEDATKHIREMVNSITLDRAFDAEKWKHFKFFPLVRPKENIFPARTVYDGRTQNIGSNYLTSEEPIWYILQRLEPPPFSFLLTPQVDSQGGLPANVDGSYLTLVTSYTSNRCDGLNSECVNIFDREIYRLALKHTAKLDKVIPRTYGHVLYLYTKHPEAKSIAPDGTACTCETRGLLQPRERNRQEMEPRRRFAGDDASGQRLNFGAN